MSSSLRRRLFLSEPPPIDPRWEGTKQKVCYRPVGISDHEYRELYQAECADLRAAIMAPGARDEYLGEGVELRQMVFPARDSFHIPVIRYAAHGAYEKFIIIYYHGGGLKIGEANSEELSCRRIIKDIDPSLRNSIAIYSVGYRLLSQNHAQVCVDDSVDAFYGILDKFRGSNIKFFLLGSSSGGQLAAHVCELSPPGSVSGLLLRCPVTSDAFQGRQYVPERFHDIHNSADNTLFHQALSGRMDRVIPRDGLARMPLEIDLTTCSNDKWPRTWLQMCTNDSLYSDAAAYAILLDEGGVEVRYDVQKGWPHTFWLRAPWLPSAVEAERTMIAAVESMIRSTDF